MMDTDSLKRGVYEIFRVKGDKFVVVSKNEERPPSGIMVGYIDGCSLSAAQDVASAMLSVHARDVSSLVEDILDDISNRMPRKHRFAHAFSTLLELGVVAAIIVALIVMAIR